MSAVAAPPDIERLYAAAEADFARWELVKDVVDECIDIALDTRQSGHPGGSRSKVHMLLALMLSGAMRWDIRRPWLRFADRFVLSAGHTVPAIYSILAVLNDSLRARVELDGDERFVFPGGGRWALTPEWLLRLRRRDGLPGHAEMAGRTMFLKANTGPSGHGMPFAAGEALALKLAGAEDVKVFVVEGEGGLTPGATHEVKNTAWGLGLSNLVFLVDWNDFGIDSRPASAVVHGGPVDWFEPYGWRVLGTEDGMAWPGVTRTVLEAARGGDTGFPTMAWFRTQKGRGYGKVDAASHGTPWPRHSPEWWAVRGTFMSRHGVEYAGVGEAAPSDPDELMAQAAHNLDVALSVLRRDPELVRWLSDRLLAIAETVPVELPEFRLGSRSEAVFSDARLFDPAAYPASLWKKPGEKAPNRAGLAAWGGWVNSTTLRERGRPLFIAAAADLAESTNLAGFGHGFEGQTGGGWYERDANPTGSLLPTEITEFTNAGMLAGMATVNLAEDPFASFDGFWGAVSTYGSFSYLKYGPLRLFSQLAQDSELKLGRVLYVAGHSGPETAEDSRTHFGIFSPGVMQLFPKGHAIELHPWEYNEVPVLLAAAFRTDVPIVVLHLTRPPIEIPDRAALGMPSHLEAARGAYVLRDWRAGEPRAGTVFVRGTMSTQNLVALFPELDRRGLNVRVVAAESEELFRRQDPAYRESIASDAHRLDAMVVTNGAVKLMRDWASGPVVEAYSLGADWDDRWRTGGSVDEVIEEAHLDQGHILEAVERFVRERDARLARTRAALETLGAVGA
ncbi:MAG TPA: transketolase [Candidatus Dormibacteraeota bacterium]|nr:transketolase [Candidatus Dormibacteraeota bacterium]